MRTKFMSPKSSFLHALGIALFLFLVGATSACATDYSDTEMQPLAATAFDLARAVRRYAASYPDKAKILSDRELVQQATAHDPSLMAPYNEKGLIVRGLPSGIVLVCSSDGVRGLFEDAACSARIDSERWSDPVSRCTFEVDLETVCDDR